MCKVKCIAAIIGCLISQMMETGVGATVIASPLPARKIEERGLKEAGPGANIVPGLGGSRRNKDGTVRSRIVENFAVVQSSKRVGKKAGAVIPTIVEAAVPAPQFPTALSPEVGASSGTAGAEFETARREFEAGRYDRARDLLEKVMAQSSLSQPVRSEALRLSADCCYFLGMKGSSPVLLTAVEKYRLFLQQQPDPTAGNELVYYRIAQSYEKLNYYREAAASLEKLVAIYPDSPLAPEATFRHGMIDRQAGKYDGAVERLTAYLVKNPAGRYAKIAAYTVGDCYYRLQKSESASRWYEWAFKKWPDIQDISVTILINMGNHYFAIGKFDTALQLFTYYTNLFPSAELGKKAFYMMARISEAMGESAQALKLYRMFLERYPVGSGADDCALAMARLGVARPGIKFPGCIISIDDYLAPLQTYDRLLAKSSEGENAAAVMLSKGDALISYGRLKEGFDIYLACLTQFPEGKRGEEGRTKLRILLPSLVDNYYRKNDYLAVTKLYFEAGGKGFSLVGDFDSGVKIAESLLASGFYEEAAAGYGALKEISPDRERGNRIALALAKIDIMEDRAGSAEANLTLLLKNEGKGKDQTLGKEIKLTLADLYYKKGLYAKANLLYADILPAGGEGLGAAYRNYGRSLQALHLTETAITNYLKVLKDREQHPGRYPADIMADIYTGLGDAYYEAMQYEEGIAAYRQAIPYLADDNVGRWLNYRIGKGYLLLHDYGKAEKIFRTTTAKVADEFWPKVMDYAREDARRLGQTGYQK